jgi:hypothetical protein
MQYPPQQDVSDSVTATATTCTATSATTTKLTTTKRERREKSTLLLSEIPTPAWQDIVMDRTSWNKMLRSIYTN